MSDNDIHYHDPVLLQRFLDDQLADDEEQRMSQHIDVCKTCRERLEKLLVSAGGWHDLQANLADFDHEETIAVSIGGQSATHEPLFDFRSLLGPTDDPAMLGRLGKYEITGVIGQGSTGIVFKAFDSSLSRYVAIKALSPTYATNGLARTRFEREGRAIAAVRNRHVNEVHGVDAFQSTPFIVMQYLPAGSLQKRITEHGFLSTIEVCRIGMQIAEGLAGAHRQGIIHRDIKPANILMEDDLDQAIVSDFGLARVADESSMTQTGVIAGTPEYMSPEQARGEILDARSDLFSLGCVMYAACTGHSPFRGATLVGVIHNVREVDPRPIRESNPEIDEWLAAFIDQLLMKDKLHRFESASQVSQILEAELAHLQAPTSSPRPNRDWWNQKALKRKKSFVLICLCAIFVSVAVWMLISEFSKAPFAGTHGIKPTRQEEHFHEAKAAYDLAYETHLAEAEYRGDMQDSIKRHKAAFEFGYNKSESAFNLARAYALQDSDDEALLWLRKAVKAGFHNVARLNTEKELDRIRSDARFTPIENQVAELARKYEQADRTYFGEVNYPKAEQLYRQWLIACPNDDHATLMLGAALLEQGKFEEAQIWNERARKTVRYAGFANYNLGCIAAQRGSYDAAFNALYYAVDTGFTDADHLENDHHLVALHSDSRFELLLNKLRKNRR